MSTIRRAGRLNENTTLVDIGMYGLQGITAAYLVRGAKTCLIDAGLSSTARRLTEILRGLDAFPLDVIVITHPHSDHAGGVLALREAAADMGGEIEVLAGREAVPLLTEGRFLDLPDSVPYEPLADVTPVGEGDTVDLGGVRLRVIDVPGHCPGHIAALDERDGTMFLGDALGYKITDTVFLPPFVPSAWDPEAFLGSVGRLRRTSYSELCLAHFGCVRGREAQTILDEAIETYEVWWWFFERHADRLGDTDFLLGAMRSELEPGVPTIRPISTGDRISLKLLLLGASVVGRRTATIDKLAFAGMVKSLAHGYEMYVQSH